MNDPNGPAPNPWVPPAPAAPSAGPGAWNSWSSPPAAGPIGYEAYQPRPRSSTTPVIIGVVVIGLGAVLVAALAAVVGGLGAFMETASGPALAEGQCINGGRPQAPAGATPLLGDVDVIDCALPHDSEVIAAFAYPSAAGASYPGDRILSSYAEAECYVHFERYVGISFQRSRYEMTFVTPLEFNWTIGDKSMQCLVHPPGDDELATGTVRGSRR
jgi:hypothetical protein